LLQNKKITIFKKTFHAEDKPNNYSFVTNNNGFCIVWQQQAQQRC